MAGAREKSAEEKGQGKGGQGKVGQGQREENTEWWRRLGRDEVDMITLQPLRSLKAEPFLCRSNETHETWLDAEMRASAAKPSLTKVRTRGGRAALLAGRLARCLTWLADSAGSLAC